MSDDNVLTISGWAPGNYMCRCVVCGMLFAGDKRSTNCLSCGAKAYAVASLSKVHDEAITALRAENEKLRAEDGYDVYAAAREEYRKKIAEQAAENEKLRDEATRIALEAQKVCLQNIQMKFALGYPMDANLEKYVLPENPFKCGTCAALRAALSTARADALEEAAKAEFLRPLVEEQAKGEWDDKTIDEDVAFFSAAIRALIKAEVDT